MKIFLKRALFLMCALTLVFGLVGCPTEPKNNNIGGGTIGDNEEKQLSTHLVDFSNSGVQWSNGFKNNGGELGTAEQWVVYNHKVDLAEDVIVLKSKVNFNTLSGHTGVGFISVDGTSRKGYQLLSGQNIKNVGCTDGGSGQGFDTKVDGFGWATDTDYVFEVTIKEGKISYVVYDTTGAELAAKKDTTIYHNASDIVYPAFGGTRGSAATYSDISVSINGKTVSIDGIDPQSQLATLSLDKSIVRIKTTETATVTATATEAGASVPVTAESSDTSIASVSVSNNVITVTPVKMGSVKVTVKHTKADYLTASFDVVVADYPSSNIYGSLATVTYPAAASTDAYEDATLRLAFDAAPTLSDGGFISIYKEDGTLVDTITMIDEIQKTAAGNSIKVKNQLVRVDGNNVLITPHVGVIQPETKYFVGIPEGSITGKINGKDFNGLSNDKDAADSWSFTTRAAVAATSVMTVNASESSESDFRSINGALAAIGTTDTGSYTINVAAGTYYELINTKIAGTVKIVGPTNTLGDSVIIKYINHNDWNGGTAIRPSFYVGGTGNLVLENVTIWNATRRGVDTEAQEAQAEAIYFQSTGKLAAYNCSFKSYQDTIQVGNKGGKAWFYKCYIEGDVDYIWGTADVALFEECKFKTLNDDNRKTKTSDLLVARTYKQGSKIAKGFVVFNSEIEIENGMTQTFGRCAGSGSDFWDQGAAINTKITGTGTLDPAFWQAKNYNPMKDHETFVGWKDYNITNANDEVISASSRCEKTYAISDEVYAKEFNGRRAILNRVYNVDEGVYVSGNAWDVEELEASWGASADESLNNDYSDEVVINTNTFDFTKGIENIVAEEDATKTLTLTGSGFQDAKNYGAKNAGTATFDVTGSALITFYPTYKMDGTVTLYTSGDTTTPLAEVAISTGGNDAKIPKAGSGEAQDPLLYAKSVMYTGDAVTLDLAIAGSNVYFWKIVVTYPTANTFDFTKGIENIVAEEDATKTLILTGSGFQDAKNYGAKNAGTATFDVTGSALITFYPTYKMDGTVTLYTSGDTTTPLAEVAISTGGNDAKIPKAGSGEAQDPLLYAKSVMYTGDAVTLDLAIAGSNVYFWKIVVNQF